MHGSRTRVIAWLYACAYHSIYTYSHLVHDAHVTAGTGTPTPTPTGVWQGGIAAGLHVAFQAISHKKKSEKSALLPAK